MAAHVRRINSQDKIATGILTAIVGLVLRKPLAKFMSWYVEQVESSKLVG